MEATSPAIIPSLFDTVAVLWEVEGEGEVWWNASVVELDPVTMGKVIGLGTLQYVARGKHGSSYSSVEFLSGNFVRERKELRRARLKPAVSWRAVNDEDGGSDNNIHCDRDVSYIVEKSPRTGCAKGNMRGVKRKHDDQAANNAHKQAERCNVIETNMRHLQDTIANLASDMKLVQASVERKADRPRLSPFSSQYMASKRHLLCKLLEQLNRTPRRSERDEMEGSDDCVGVQLIKVSIDCDLALFRDFAAELHSISGESTAGEAAEFYPAFSDTQSQLIANKTYHVIIRSLQALCTFFQVSEFSDRKSMLWLDTSAKGERICRIAGSYLRGRRDGNEQSSIEFHVGRSSGSLTDNMPCDSERQEPNAGCDTSLQLEAAVEAPSVFTLVRDRAEWNSEEQRYNNAIRSCWTNAVKVGDSRSATSAKKAKHAFQMIWKGRNRNAARLWSSALTCDDVLIGTLELMFPTVIIPGDEHCAEFMSLLSEEVTKRILYP